MADTSRITEEPSDYVELDKMEVTDILVNINNEDKKVPAEIEKSIPKISELVRKIEDRYKQNGRLFYIGAGTSGRVGILDASEIPPTYGIFDRIIGLIAGGDQAIRKAVEFAEDSLGQAEVDLKEYYLNENDTLIGIAASGTTPYVIGGMKYAKSKKALVACLTNNPDSPLAEIADIAIEVVVGPEFVTGSTRMKSGTSQKLVLNMISTALMIRVGRVKGNRMINMQVSNKKLLGRGLKMIMDETGVSKAEAEELLKRHGSVREAMDYVKSS